MFFVDIDCDLAARWMAAAALCADFLLFLVFFSLVLSLFSLLFFLLYMHTQGMSTPQPRTKFVGALPIHHLKSAFLSKNDVSVKMLLFCFAE